MKTINGITFAQLHNLQPAELNEYLASFTTLQTKEYLTSDTCPFAEEMKRHFTDEYFTILSQGMLEAFNQFLTDEIYAGMRKLYDTEERFDIAADMMSSFGNMAGVAQEVSTKMFDRLIQSKL